MEESIQNVKVILELLEADNRLQDLSTSIAVAVVVYYILRRTRNA